MQTDQLYQLFRKYPVISTDSRRIPAGCLFFALKGENFDGNRYAKEALEKGAACAVVDRPDMGDDPRLFRVDDTLTALQRLAGRHRRQLGVPVIAITGSNGKTTTKELMAAVLRRKFSVTFTQGNLNNHIGVPLTLLSMNDRTELAVIEMGANHPGEIATLCRIAEPDLGLVTNIGKAHLEGFGSFEAVIRAKSELYDYLRAHGGKCFVNSDNPLLVEQAAGLDMLTYGTGDGAQLRGVAEEDSWFLTVHACFLRGRLSLKSQLTGSYNAENILAAARAGIYFGVDPAEIQKAIAGYEPDNNRSQLLTKGSNRIVLDAYNANPTSMNAAIANFVRMHLPENPPKIVILGDMLELGPYEAEEHRKIAELIRNGTFAGVYLVGPRFAGTDAEPSVKKFHDAGSLALYLRERRPENSLILIKGSRGMGLEQLVSCL